MSSKFAPRREPTGRRLGHRGVHPASEVYGFRGQERGSWDRSSRLLEASLASFSGALLIVLGVCTGVREDISINILTPPNLLSRR